MVNSQPIISRRLTAKLEIYQREETNETQLVCGTPFSVQEQLI
jgi:hypothetical protein